MKTKLQKDAFKSGLAIILLTILVISVSYAWLTLTLEGTKTNVIKAGTLALNLEDGTSVGISDLFAMPLTDEEGLDLTPYTFILENNGDIDSEYSLYLDNLDLLTDEIRMPDSMIKYSLSRNGEVIKTELLSKTGVNPNRILDTGIIPAGEDYTYNLRLWIDENATSDVIGTTFRGIVRVEASQIIQKVPTYVMMNGSNFNEVIQNYAPDATSVVFTDTAAPSTASITDVSDAGDGSVVAWLDDTTYYVSSQRSGVKVIANEDCSEMFYGRTGLTSINLSMLDTSAADDMSWMFSGCSALTSLDLSNFNTAAASNMSEMFSGCSALTSLDLSNFNTAAASNMSWMFYNCSALESVTFPEGFGQAATDMSGMFYRCSALTSLDLSNFNTAASNMSRMFYNCSALESVTFPEGFGQVATVISYMFDGCSALTSLTFPEGFGQAADEMSGVFSGCSSLQSLTLPEGFGAKDTSMTLVFEGCSSLQSLTLPEGFGAKVTSSLQSLFEGCSSLQSLTLPEGFGANATHMPGLFEACSSLQSLTLPEGFGAKATNIGSMFSSCSSLQSLALPDGFGAQVTHMGFLFENCTALKSVAFGDGWSTANVTDMRRTFDGCSSLTLDCSGWNVDNVINHYYFNHNAPGVTPPAWVN